MIGHSLKFTIIAVLLLQVPAVAQFPVPTPPPGFPTDALTAPKEAKAKRGKFLFTLTSKAQRKVERKVLKQYGYLSDNLIEKQIKKSFGIRRVSSVKGSDVLSASGVRGKRARKFRKAAKRTGAKPEKVLKRFAFASDDFFLQFGLVWNLENIGIFGKAGFDIAAEDAWNITEGSPSVVVGVIDTGVLATHPDLQANMFQNDKEELNGIDDDGNGYIDDVSGWDFINNDNDPTDDHFHGTHVAGIIAAERNNGKGIAGVAPRVKILPLKILGAQGEGDTEGLVRAVEYAVALKKAGVNIKVINASLGGGDPVDAMKEALRKANSAGITFVAAAGNDGADNDNAPVYPAGYDVPNVISVAAMSSTGQLAGFSNYGARSVDVAAPGDLIWSPIIHNFYLPASGTSQAAPHVAGIAALIASQHGGFSPTRIKDRIMNTVTPISELNGKMQSPGMVNAYNALQ